MKKFLFVFILAIIANVSNISYASIKEAGHYGKGYPAGHYYKGNISPDKLPDTIKKYLKETYPDHYIIVSKKKGNGNYFVKIRYGGDKYRSYYRSLVFADNGSLIKG